MARVKPLMEVLRGVTRFGRLTVTGEAPRIVSPSGFAALAAYVRCDCGVEKVVRACGLKSGDTMSCGCLQKELTAVAIAQRSVTHGQARTGRGGRTSEYSIWVGMKNRCSSADIERYARYVGRGIAVCDRWRDSFEAFYEDMGPKPSAKHSIERVDNDGDYEPGNCRWATQAEQANNRGNSRLLRINERELTATQWAAVSGVPAHIVFVRLRNGWDAERAVFQKPMRKGVKRPHLAKRKAA
jgi:hypothetical protein